jgi:hypothetical protein
MPKLAAVAPAGALKVRVEWSVGSRASKKEVVDLGPLIQSLKFYKPLRRNVRLFRSVHLIRDGRAIAWGADDIDMSASSVERLAEEAMSADELRQLMQANNLTHSELASALGRSRRQLENYLSGHHIPRIVGLACFGYSMRKRQAESPIGELIIQPTGQPPKVVSTARQPAVRQLTFEGSVLASGTALIVSQ